MKMRAALFYEHGGIDKICFDEIDRPVPKPGEVLVQVKAGGLNHLDI